MQADTCSDGDVSEETRPLVEDAVSIEAGNGNRCRGNCGTDSTCYRYTVMVFVCMVGVGDYFCYDNPAALEDHILTDLDITESRYMLFYSSIQWLQIGACLFGGYLIDKVIGIRLGLFISSVFITLSQALFAGGALVNSYWTMVVGRMIFGIVDGTQWLSLEKMVVRWFKSKELTLVLGLKISLGRVGTVANMNLMGPVYASFNRNYEGHTSLGLALFVGAGVCVVSTLFSSGLCYLDRRADTFISKTYSSSKSTDDVRLTDVKHFPMTYWLVALTITFYLMTILSFIALGQSELELSLKEIDTPTSLPCHNSKTKFAFATSACRSYSVAGTLQTESNNGDNSKLDENKVKVLVYDRVFFERKYGLSLDIASNVNSIAFIIGACVMPVVGTVIDKVGRNLYWMFCGLILQLGCHLLLTFTFISPYVAMSILGISYSITSSAMWPLVPYVVHLNYIGTAFGIVCTLIALGQAGNTYLAGYLADTYGYITMEALFLSYSCVALVLGSLLYVIDSAQDGSLNLTKVDRLLYEETIKTEQKNTEKKSQ